ncbi:hypothetical protein AB0H12_26345 [Actinosynnema sp. NPDC023794]
MSVRVTPPFPGAPADRVLLADRARGATLRSAEPTTHEFAGQEGRGEILNVITSDAVRPARHGCPETGADAVKTNTFGVDLAGSSSTRLDRAPSRPASVTLRAQRCGILASNR